MAELIITTVGQAAASAILPPVLQPLGAALAGLAGATIGRGIDQRLFGETRRIEGPRLDELRLTGASEGAGVAIVQGRMRLSGQLIWAARFKETAITEDVQSSSGGKGGAPPAATVTTYSYSLSFAVGLCEGEVARIERAWVNGEPLDLSTIAWRFYPGAEDQAADPLIEAVEGASETPAYRGLAYIVFEDFPLDPYGVAIPHLSFEIVRKPPRADAAPRLEDMAQGVCLIPGAGEFALASQVIRRDAGYGRTEPENQHADPSRADLLVSLDQLEQDLPNAKAALVVVGWFGNDLRCGVCEIRPGVEIAQKTTSPIAWRAGGVDRVGARLISQVDGGPSFGGTPSDDSVLQAIAELKARGFFVGLYPFVFMDIPGGTLAPDPYGAAFQPAYPWRGRITPSPAAGQPGAADQTAAARTQIAAFFGTAAPADAVTADGGVGYVGPAEWSYRRFVFHYARLAAVAGGVDAFILGSELRALTTARDNAGAFPAVEQLQSLAADVRTILGPAAKLTYAADWSEYFGHQPSDGSGDVVFHLDPLWADANIDAVGIDWYPPLTDWREGEAHLDASLSDTIYDPEYLDGRITAGEAFEWYYASDADRRAQIRTEISDGAYGEPWVFRPKDLQSWWGNAHHNRPAGVRAASPTAWIPQSKPIWLIELGVPAVDKGANAPNLFADAKSSESALAPFSLGHRDDLIQRRAVEAYLRFIDPASGRNPTSSVYAQPMIDPARTFLWAWDARPFPAFPARVDVWSDGPAWALGHWLNGRAGAVALGDAVGEIAARAVVVGADGETLRGTVAGAVFDAPTNARAMLAPLASAHDFGCVESGGVLRFTHAGPLLAEPLTLESLAQETGPRARAERPDALAAAREARVRFIDADQDYRLAVISARGRDALEANVIDANLPIALTPLEAEAIAERLLAQSRGGAERARLSLSPLHLALEPGDRVSLALPGLAGTFRVEAVEEGLLRRLELRAAVGASAPLSAGLAPAPSVRAPVSPLLAVLDLPPLPGFEADSRPIVAAYADPWPGGIEIFAGEDAASASLRATLRAPACLGRTLDDLYPGPTDRFDDGAWIRAELAGPAPVSVSKRALYDGANVFAVRAAGGWALFQALNVELTAPGVYALHGLLRGQQGTEGLHAALIPAGSAIVRLDAPLARADLREAERGVALSWFAAGLGRGAGDALAATASESYARVWAKPFAPTHLRAVREASGDVRLTWIRRARIGGDDWEAAEVPLGEAFEAYRVEILIGGAVARTFAATAPEALYTLAEQTADHGGPPSSLTVRVAQMSEAAGAGAWRESVLYL